MSLTEAKAFGRGSYFGMDEGEAFRRRLAIESVRQTINSAQNERKGPSDEPFKVISDKLLIFTSTGAALTDDEEAIH